MRFRTNAAVAATVVAAAAAATWSCSSGAGADVGADTGAGAVEEGTILTVRTAPAVRSESFGRRSLYRGQIEARRRSEVGFDLAGTLERVVVDEGDRVADGAVLAELDTRRLEARSRQLEAAVAEARTAYDLATSTLDRFERAAQRSAVSPQDVDEARRARDSAAAALDRTRAERDLVEVDLEKSRLRAPFRSLVVERRLDEGQVVMAGTPVLVLLEVDRPRARVGLPIEAARALEREESVDVRVGQEVYPARRLALLPEQATATRTVDVLLELDASLGELRVGETAVLSLEDRSQASGFELPLAALTESSRGLWSVLVTVPVSADEAAPARATHRIEQRPVEVVELDTSGDAGARALVRGALQEGDLIVLDGLQRLVVGQWVIAETVDAGRPALATSAGVEAGEAVR